MNDAAEGGYFPPTAFSLLAAAESQHWWFRSRNRILIWAMKNQLEAFQNFLEIGCGTGFVLEGIRKEYPHAELFGSEYFEEALQHARERIPSATFYRLDVTQMNDEGRFDVIGAFDVLEHIEEDEKVIENIACALRPGGAFLITVPQHRWLWSSVDEHACHVRRYTRSELVCKLQRAGLRPKMVTSFVSLLLPLMWLSRIRFRFRFRSANHDPISELHIPIFLNRVLEAIMIFERKLLERGLRLPAGGSLLVVGDRP